jgi:TonB C terminal
MNTIKATIRLVAIAAVVVILAFVVGWPWAEFDTERGRLALEKAKIGMCFLSMNGTIAPLDDAELLYYPDESPNCLHRPRVEPSWHRALVWHLHQYKRYLSDTQSRGAVLLGFTVDRSGHVVNREIVTVEFGRVVNRKIVRNSEQRELENEAMAMIEHAEPLPPFPASMAEAKLDLIAPIFFLPPGSVPRPWQN